MTRQLLKDGWHLQTAALVGRDGAALSQPGAEAIGWHDTCVPSTVLCALVRAGLYPDPRFELNVFRIPDSSAEFNAEQGLARFSHLPDQRNPWRDPWWYRTEFDLAPLSAGRRVWLNLDCLNYRAEVWVNGTRVADSEEVAGMFRRFRLDITAHVTAGQNALALLVYPVDHPGTPDTQLEVYGKVRGFHKEIMRDVTEVMTVGYDCFPTVPDRNMGLIQEVWLDFTGPVDLRDPFVRTALPTLERAVLTIAADVINTAPAAVSGTLRGQVHDPAGEVVATFSRPVALAAGEQATVVCAGSDDPALVLANPHLWWPRGYGDQPLYGLTLWFEADGEPSAQIAASFGIRRLERELHERDGAHGFRLLVNGRRVFLRGGYVQPEMMFDWDEARIAAEIRYLAEANLNYLVFEDIPNPPDCLLEACDESGMLFWNCFYDCYWLQPGTEYPDDLALLEACTIDLVKRYRNHPSLCIYMAQNEGETREVVYEMWRRRVLELDDTRLLVPSGSFPDYRTEFPAWLRQDTPVGMNDYPPKAYSWQTPATYYRLVREQPNWMFMIESGSASLPPLESLVQFIPGLRDLPPNPGTDPVYPLDAAWAHYGANTYYEWFDKGLRLMYGEPTDVRDYVRKAQLVGYDQHRAFFEAVHHRMWEITSGFGEWKISSAFPDVQWQLYDWFLRPMVSLFAIRKACAPWVVQLSPLDGTVTVINNTGQSGEGLQVRGTVHDLQLQRLGQCTERATVPADCFHDVCVLPQPQSVAEAAVYFVKLELRDAAGALLADNFYWLSPRLQDCETVHTGDMRKLPANQPVEVPREQPCFPELSDLPPVRLTVSGERTPGARPRESGVRVRVSNPGADLAFFIRLRLTAGAAGEEVLPAFWEDNYFSLLPGESKEVAVAFPAGPEDLAVQADGWNIVSTAAGVE